MASAIKGGDCNVGGAPHDEIHTQGDWMTYFCAYTTFVLL